MESDLYDRSRAAEEARARRGSRPRSCSATRTARPSRARSSLTKLDRLHRPAQRLRPARTRRTSASRTSGPSTASRCRRTCRTAWSSRPRSAPGLPRLQARGLRSRRPAGHTRHPVHDRMLNTLKTRLADPRGSALVPALMITVMMLGFGMAMLTLVEGNQGDSRRERERESSFELAEGVLNAQIYRLSTRWPIARSRRRTRRSARRRRRRPTARARSTRTSRARTTRRTCSGRSRSATTALAARTSTRRASSGPRGTAAQDLNDDNFLWVRAEATVAGRKRVARRARRGGERRAQLPQRHARGRQVRGLELRQQGHDRHERRRRTSGRRATSSSAATRRAPAARSGTSPRARSSRTR